MDEPASRTIWGWPRRELQERRAAARLKRDGFIQSLVVIGLGFLAKNLLHHRMTGDVLVILGALQGLVATWHPLWLRPARRFGFALGRVVGTVLSWLLLVPFFALVILPVAVGLRLRGRDPLHRQPLAPGLTAWIPRRRGTTAASLARQFLDEDREARALQRPDGTLPDPALLRDLDRRGEVDS